MQVSVEQTGALERRLTVQVPAGEVQAKIDKRLRELGQKVRISGFRPGKVPKSVLQQRYGQQVRQEVFQQTVQTTLAEALEQEKLRPVVQPRLDPAPDPNAKGDLEYTAVVEIYPEMANIDVSSLELTVPAAEVEESDVDDMLETLRQQRVEWNTVERQPAEGDQAVIEYVAQAHGERVPENGHQRLSVVLGSSGFDALEQALAGMSPGETKTIDLAFPEQYREQQLAGKTASVELSLKEVQEAELPEVDEAFIRSFGIESGDVDTLRREVRANLERELRQALVSQKKIMLIETLIAGHPELEVPESLIRSEAESMRAQAAQGSEGNAPDISAFIGAAERRVKAGMLISELAMQNGIRVDTKRVRQTIQEVASTYEQAEQVMQMYYNDQRLLQNVENAVLEEQVVDWAMDHAKVTPKPTKFRDVIAKASRSA